MIQIIILFVNYFGLTIGLKLSLLEFSPNKTLDLKSWPKLRPAKVRLAQSNYFSNQTYWA